MKQTTTCIVAIRELDGGIWMGGDSAGVEGLSIVVRRDKKVFLKDNMIFGFTSSFRMGQLLQYSLTIPEQSSKQNDYSYMVNSFVPAIIKCFEEGGYLKKKDEVKVGGTFLVGYRG